MISILAVTCLRIFSNTPSAAAIGTFNFNDGTTQGWTLDQMYDDSTQNKFTPVSGYTLVNDNNELSAYASTLLIGNSSRNDIYLESPDLTTNTDWQGIDGYSLDVTRYLASGCWGDISAVKFYVQLQIKVIDTADGNKEKTYAEHDGTDFVFHEIATYKKLYQLTWKTTWLADPKYKVKKIRIRIIGPGDVMWECWYSGSWNIDNVTAAGGSGTSESITVTNPNGGQKWEAATPHMITWTCQGIDNKDIKLEYSTDGGTSYNFISYYTNTGNSGSYTWTVPNDPSANCLIRLSTILTTTISDESDAPFEITATPYIKLDVPNGGENWNVGSPRYIVWNTHLFDGPVKIEYSTNSGTNYSTIENSYSGSSSYAWTVPNTTSGNCLVRVSDASDGQPYDISDAVFTISSNIQVNTPTGSNVVVGVTGAILLLFSQVNNQGDTQALLSPIGPLPPTNRAIIPVNNPIYYNISTTATYSGAITIEITYDDAGLLEHEPELKLMRYEEISGEWTDITKFLNMNLNIITGETDHLSEFALMITSGVFHPGGAILVTNCDDAGPGSLREAINTANTHTGPDTILFTIPQGVPGHDADVGIWVITLQTQPPIITDPNLIINGFSQAEFIGSDCNPNGPEIVIQGNPPQVLNGLEVQTSEVIIMGLTIGNFSTGITMNNADGCHIRGCYVGTDFNGFGPVPNSYGIWIGNQSSYIIIAPMDTFRNVISGNTNGGIFVSDTSHHVNIFGNIIGLNSRADAPLGNGNYGGICIQRQCDSVAVFDNTIASNRFGIYVIESSHNKIQNNWIGRTTDLFFPELGNESDGVFIAEESYDNQIIENFIWFNGYAGVRIYGEEPFRNRISHNSITQNSSVGITYDAGGANVLPQPTITNVSSTSVSGISIPDAIVEIYTDSQNQGERFQGETMSDGSGNFHWTGSITGPYPNVTVLAIDADGNTTSFSNPLMTDIQITKQNRTPETFALLQNYPNPFNPTTIIEFEIKEPCHVILNIYDLLGREVADLVHKYYEPGHYHIQFDARHLPTGLYFYQIKTKDFSAVRKMAVMR